MGPQDPRERQIWLRYQDMDGMGQLAPPPVAAMAGQVFPAPYSGDHNVGFPYNTFSLQRVYDVDVRGGVADDDYGYVAAATTRASKAAVST
jgi:hypothetical protein